MSRTSKLLLYCALLGLAPGCAMKSPEMSAASPPSGAAAMDMDTPSPAPMDPSADGDYGGLAKAEASYKDARGGGSDDMAPTSVTAAPARSGPTSTPGSGGEGKLAEPKPRPSDAREGQGVSESDDTRKQYARQIVYTAEMQISVYKLDDAMARAEELTLAAGGYVQNLAQGYYVLRIPAPALRGVMDELARLGVVEARTLQARDVTEEYVDLTTRIRVLRETQTQLLSLLKQARNVDETLKVRESLDQITMQLEQAMGRLRMLESQIGFSTLTVRMSQRGPQNTIPSSNDPFPWVDGLGVEATEWN
jgi:hypothetical protein